MTRIVFYFLVIAFFCLSFKIGDYSLFDLDEPRYPQAAREMLHAHDWLLPHFNQEYRFHKPVLFYWAEILSSKIFGFSEFAARLPSVIAAVLLLLLVYHWGKSRSIGLLVACILMTSLEFFVLARMSITDMLLNLCISGALIIFFLIYDKILKSNYFYLFGVFLGLGFLTKGPVAVLIPLLVIFVFLIFQGRIFFAFEDIFKILVAFSFVGLPWFVIAHIKSAGEFTKVFFLDHNINRYTSIVSGHKSAWWIYSAGILGGFLPWTFFLPQLGQDLWKSRKNYDAGISFALIWFFVTFLFYNCAATRLLNYILPCFTPLAFLLASFIKNYSRSLKIGIIFFAIFASLYDIGYLLGFKTKITFLDSYANREVLYMGFLFVLVIAIYFLLNKKQDFSKAFQFFSSLIVLIWLTGVSALWIPLGHYLTGGIKDFCLKIRDKNLPIYILGMERPSLVYYCDSKVTRIAKKDFDNFFAKNQDSSFYILIKESSWNSIKDKVSDKMQIVKTDPRYRFVKY